MPTLNWIGKEKVVSHHRDVPFRVLEHQYGYSAEKGEIQEPTGSGNMIIHGDNLEALKALLPKYEGRINCIYIDPPYNTGNEGWVYNDNVNHPKIKKWLEATLKANENGKEASIGVDDLARHDKWLCMMYPRLRLLHKLLADDGAIFISIDDNEDASLKYMLDEIFGASNIIGKVCWFKKRKGSYLSKEFVSLTEYVYIYRKKKKLLLFGGKPNSNESQPLVKRTNSVGILKFPANKVTSKLKDGAYSKGKYGKGTSAVTLLNDITINEGIIENEFELEAPFIWSQKFLEDEIDIGAEITINTKSLQPRVFRNSEDKHKGFPSYIDGREMSATTDDAYETLKEIFSTDRIFDYSKPYQLIAFLVNSITHFNKKAIVLDSFAGSGTTAHAVLQLNKQDDGKRKFILVEMENYANTITSERVKRVINGYGDKEGHDEEFDYITLGQPLFKGENKEFINEDLETEKICEYIWYTETHTPYKNPNTNASSLYFLGSKESTAYYFFYEKETLTTLDHDFLATIKSKSEQYIIYADNCLLSKDFMAKNNIIFKKIPRDITRF